MNTNADITARIFTGIACEKAVNAAQAQHHHPDTLRTAALALATVEVTDYGTCTGEDLVDMADRLAGDDTTLHGAILQTMGNLRDLAWALEDGTITIDTL